MATFTTNNMDGGSDMAEKKFTPYHVKLDLYVGTESEQEILGGMLTATPDRFTSREKQLASALMSMVNQFFEHFPNDVIDHACMSAEEQAIDTLVDFGLATKVHADDRRGWRLNWIRLEGETT